MELTVQKIAELIGGKIHGEGARVIRGAAGLPDATPEDVSFVRSADNEKTLRSLTTTKAGAIIVPEGLPANGKTVVEVKNPIAAFATILQMIMNEKKTALKSIHPQAVIAKSAKIGADVTIGPFCVIEENAEIGDGARLVSQVYVGAHSKIGKNSILYPQVVIREETRIGERCILHAGAVIGSDGYGFYFANGKHNKIPQIGTVIIEDDVEIGSCTSIDRATTGATIIRKGTKIDNLVQIAHNVEIGDHSLVVAQVGIAGSSKLGKGVVLAGQVGIADHVIIGDGVQVGAQSGLKDDVPAGAILFGSPAQPLGDAAKQWLLLKRLPQLFKQVKKLQKTNENND